MKGNLLHTAIEKQTTLNPLTYEILGTKVRAKKQEVDAKILIKYNQNAWEYNVEIKSQIVPAQVYDLKDRMKGLKPYILIANYISPQAKQMLRDNDISYMDAAGNIFFKEKQTYIHIETHKNNKSRLLTNNRAFSKTGLKVTYQFLIHPDYLNKPYRFIADQASTTIDTVGKVVRELLQEKYIIKTNNKEYQFADRTKLFQEWVTAFNRNLRPKLRHRTYRSLDKNFNWNKLVLPQQTQWGGAVAAEVKDNYLIADKSLIYTGLDFQEIAKKLKLIPDNNGKITLIEKFWKQNEAAPNVHSILIYADLLNEPNPRYIEAANKIYTTYVKPQL